MQTLNPMVMMTFGHHPMTEFRTGICPSQAAMAAAELKSGPVVIIRHDLLA